MVKAAHHNMDASGVKGLRTTRGQVTLIQQNIDHVKRFGELRVLYRGNVFTLDQLVLF